MGVLEGEAANVGPHFVLKLFVTGTTSLSARAIVNTRRICDEYLFDRYDLEVIDISRDPSRAMKEAIIAAPVLVKTSPFPPRRLIGDMSQVEKVLISLNIAVKESNP